MCTLCMLLDRSGKSIPLGLWDGESVWVRRGVLVKASVDQRKRRKWEVVCG